MTNLVRSILRNTGIIPEQNPGIYPTALFSIKEYFNASFERQTVFFGYFCSSWSVFGQRGWIPHTEGFTTIRLGKFSVQHVREELYK